MKKQNSRFYNHLHKVRKKHLEKLVHTRTHTHHTIIHIGELLIIGVIGFSSLLFANYNNSYQHLHRNTQQEINQSLAKSIEQQQPKTNQSKIISVWEMDGKVNNTFAPGYCTYGAARISPEFFPYSEDKMSQERTRGGNAIDRCENAEKAGFKIGKTPTIGSFIIYKKVGTNTIFGHVGKVMYYNTTHQSLIVRDMNWIGKFIMSDRWETANNENIKCYIYPQKTTNTNSNLIENKDKFNISIDEQTNTTKNENTENITDKNPTNNTHDKDKKNTTDKKTPTNGEHNSASPIIETPISTKEPILNQEPENTDFYKQTIDNEEIVITPNEYFSDISKHFLSQYEMKITISQKRQIQIGESIILNITIINKESKKPYQGILPFVFNSISQNTAIESSLKTIQLIHEKENTIYLKAKEKGTSSIILTIDNQEIKTIPITIL